MERNITLSFCVRPLSQGPRFLTDQLSGSKSLSLPTHILKELSGTSMIVGMFYSSEHQLE